MSVARIVMGLLVLLVGTQRAAAVEVEDPSDYVRILESDRPERWDEAVRGLLGEHDELPLLSLASVIRRLPALDADLQVRAVRAMAEHPDHPKVVPTLWDLEQRPLEPAATDRVGQAAHETLLNLIVQDNLSKEWLQRVRDGNPELSSRAEAALARLAESRQETPVPASPATPPQGRPLTSSILIASAVLSGIVGLFLFIWAFRLLQLSVRIRNRPISKVSSLALGPVAVEGQAQPTGEPVIHPVTGETCVYYAGADKDCPGARFYLEDGSGRVLVDARRAVLFSDDDVIVAGERIHVVGFADRDARGNIIIRKDETPPPPFYRRIVHRGIELLFGFGHDSGVTRMLFSDPHRCFWIWDDLERRPMGEGKDVAWLATAFVLGGAWMLVFGLAILGLIDQGTIAGFLHGI